MYSTLYMYSTTNFMSSLLNHFRIFEFIFYFQFYKMRLLFRETIGKEAFDGTCSYQVDSDSTSQQEAKVDINGMVLVLNNPGQTTNDGTDSEGEDQQGLEQLG